MVVARFEQLKVFTDPLNALQTELLLLVRQLTNLGGSRIDIS